MADSRKGKLFSKYLARMDTIKKDSYAAGLFDELSKGKNSYMRIDRLESSSFDMTWIKEIEDCIYDLGEIIANPKQVTKTVSNIVPVELAKKIGAESVMHLASHTQYIKDVTPEGDVVPNKILSMSAEDDIHTYENRFIATLIRRLVLFIEKRYEFVKKFAPLHDEEILFYKTKAIVDGSEVEIETKVKVRSESDTKIADMSNKYINRILQIREYVMYFYGSKFMKELKTERDVRNPIVMTNILRKNPKYHKCYNLFRFIERYDRLGVSYKVDEDASIFSEQELDDLNTVMLTNYLALKARDRSKVTKGKSREYKPRILTSLDDEQFIYGDLLKGPIEFLRIDEGYQQYLDSKIRTDLPIHPTKIEKEYYAEEYEEKATRKADKVELDKLSRRKRKEQAEFDKRALKAIAQREADERERIRREAEEARLAEERRIELVRQQLINEAQGDTFDQPENVEQPLEENEDIIPEEEVMEETPVEEEIPAEEETPVVEEQPIEETQPVEEEILEQVEEAPVVEETQQKEPVNEEPVQEESSNDEIDDVRAQLIADALNEEEAPVEEQPQPVEEVIAPEEAIIEEPPVEETPVNEEEPVQEEIALEAVESEPETEPQEEAPAIEEPVVEEVPVEAPAEETPIEEKKPRRVRRASKKAAKEEPPVEEAPIVEESQPEEPVVEEQPQPVEEVPAEEPVEEQAPVEEKKPRRSRRVSKKAIKEEPPVVEEPPVIEEAPQEEPAVEEPQVEEAPVIEEPSEEQPPVEEEAPKEKPVKGKTPVLKGFPGKKTGKKPAKEPKKEIVKPKDKPKAKPAEEMEKIPGKFIVKTYQGYYVGPNQWSVYKHDAKIFDDFNAANKIKRDFGGKVVKL